MSVDSADRKVFDWSDSPLPAQIARVMTGDVRRRFTHALTSRCYHGNNATAAAAAARIIIIHGFAGCGTSLLVDTNPQLFENPQTIEK